MARQRKGGRGGSAGGNGMPPGDMDGTARDMPGGASDERAREMRPQDEGPMSGARSGAGMGEDGEEVEMPGTDEEMGTAPEPARALEVPGIYGAGERPTQPAGGGAPPAAAQGGGEHEVPQRRNCGAMTVHYRLLAESPAYARARAEIENLSLRLQARADLLERTGVIRIPVVVHVVYNTAAQNISDAQVQSQITVLNRDFRRTNPDVSQVPAVWTGLVGDSEIEFFLATQDPLGAPTTGITRTSTSSTSFGTDDRVKAAATGGHDPWPTDRYLNLWVCPLTGGLLGYAQFPGGPAATDGVVITYTGFGTTGTATPPFHLGRTATHEIGHYLNLNHIWGDDGTGCTGTDNVADTPNQGGANTGAPAFPHVSCGNGPNGDMFMNYMDYVDDPVMVMFTAGQVARMRACLDGPRATLGTTVATAAPVPQPAGPAVSWGPNRLDVFVIGTDRGLWHKWWNGAWGPSPTGYEYMGGKIVSDAEVAAWGPNRLDAFVVGTDRALYHKWWDGAWHPAVTGYEYMGGKILGEPDVVAWGPNRLDVFVVGTDSALYHKWYNGAWGPSLTGYENMGGICASSPEAVAWAAGRLDVFVLGTDSALYHKWYDGAWHPSLTGYEYMGGICISKPRVVSWASGRLDVFVVGTDSALYHKWYDGAWHPSLTGYESMGGVILGAPEVVAWGPNRLDVFVIGTDRALYHKAWTGSAWVPSVTGYEYLGGICTSPPRVVSWAPNRLDIFVTGTNSALYHKAWTGSAWSPSATGWELLGGVISDFRVEPAGVEEALGSNVEALV